ncbi:pyridoxamine 5'-phosphate oxidase family protein [Endozoicomonadaceae bacterium StTr2]
MKELGSTDKTRIRRGPKRAVFDRAMLYQIFDQAHVAHVGFAVDEQSYVIPMLCWRVDNRLYIHGSNGSRMIKALTEGGQCCVTATLLDGMVLSKSAFHHSTNYRSAVVFGRFSKVTDEAEINESLKLFLEHIAPGRWDKVRPPSEKELRATTILSIEIEEASVKVRTGGPNEDKEDIDLQVWSGEMVIRQKVGQMIPDQYSPESEVAPDYSAAWGDRWEK